MFYRLIGVVVENRAEQDSKTVLEVVRIVSKWMELFTAVSEAFGAGALEQLPHVREAVRRDGMESARAAFVALLLRLCESQPLIRSITKPFAKGKWLLPDLPTFPDQMLILNARRRPEGVLR